MCVDGRGGHFGMTCNRSAPLKPPARRFVTPEIVSKLKINVYNILARRLIHLLPIGSTKVYFQPAVQRPYRRPLARTAIFATKIGP